MSLALRSPSASDIWKRMRWLIVQPSQTSCHSMYMAPSISTTLLDDFELPRLRVYDARCGAISADATVPTCKTKARPAVIAVQARATCQILHSSPAECRLRSGDYRILMPHRN